MNKLVVAAFFGFATMLATANAATVPSHNGVVSPAHNAMCKAGFKWEYGCLKWSGFKCVKHGYKCFAIQTPPK